MNKALTIVARIEAKQECIDTVKSSLVSLIEPTLKEVGCIQYDLHQDNENPAVFIFFENWESRELWQAHMQSAHLATHKNATEGMLVSVEINEMTKI